MAWYQEQGITFKEAEKTIMDSFHDKEKMSKWIVKQCLQDEYDTYNSFGSYRGFYTLVAPGVMKTAKRRNDIAKRKRAIQTLRRATPLIVWMNHILYKPPTNQTNRKSLRYKEIKEHYEQQTYKRFKLNYN